MMLIKRRISLIMVANRLKIRLAFCFRKTWTYFVRMIEHKTFIN